MNHNTTTIKWDKFVPFGKHKGETWQFVMDTDPSYLLWCHENVDWVKFSEDDLKAIKETAQYNRTLNRTAPLVRDYLFSGAPDPATEYGLEVYGGDAPF